MNRAISSLTLGVLLWVAAAPAASPRFVIDDDEYVDKVIRGSSNLLHQGKLTSVDLLRKQMGPKRAFIVPIPPTGEKLSAPDLSDRLLKSTLAVGAFYKHADDDEWDFNGSGGFVVGQDGIICTCCHVVLEQDPGVKVAYIVAADANGQVYPVESVLAADAESDTCFLKIHASGLKPLPLRAGARTGERVYCLSHPGGYYFMFTEGMVARVARSRNAAMDELGHTNGLLTRPVLFLNVTAEFAPGSSGGPIVDESCNVIGQVASIADAGEPADDHAPASPSVPVRFCTASEEILRLVRSPKGAVASKR